MSSPYNVIEQVEKLMEMCDAALKEHGGFDTKQNDRHKLEWSHKILQGSGRATRRSPSAPS